MFSGEDEIFAPPGGSWNIYPKFVAKEINLTPQSSGIGHNYNGGPIYEKEEEYCSCALTLGRGSNGKGKEPINVSSMVGSSNTVVVPPSFFSLQLPSGDGGLGFTDDNINDINNVSGKNKRKRQYTHRKTSVYSFPTNVKNLLSTGIFEGVPVKYVSWSRGAVNAYEFEKHAGCDTKHPNNNIYFPSGKSLYSLVQELKVIPQNDLLFEAIQTASGTPINIKNFKAWKVYDLGDIIRAELAVYVFAADTHISLMFHFIVPLAVELVYQTTKVLFVFHNKLSLASQFTNSGVSQLPDYQPELLSASPATPPLTQSAILQSGDHHPQPRMMMFNNIYDKNLLTLRPPSDEQHLMRVGRREFVSCLFNHPSYPSLTNLSLWPHPRKDHHQMMHYLPRQYIYNRAYPPSLPRQYIYNGAYPPPPPLRMFSGEDEIFAPPGGSWNIYPKFVAKEINLTPQSSGIGPNYNGVPIYEKGEEYCSCALTLGQGSNGKGKEPINVSSMVGSSNNVVVPPSFFSLQLPSGDGGLGFTDDNINDIDNNVPGKNKRKRQYTHRKKTVYSFPTNVKNLLSTGIFEGVPVKYVSWSRGAVNAYEFEKHAGCDTKHPNNNIYFPSGKSLYSVVQELKLIRDFIKENSLEEIIIPTPLFVPIVSYRGIMFFLRHLYIGVPSKIFSCNPSSPVSVTPPPSVYSSLGPSLLPIEFWPANTTPTNSQPCSERPSPVAPARGEQIPAAAAADSDRPVVASGFSASTSSVSNSMGAATPISDSMEAAAPVSDSMEAAAPTSDSMAAAATALDSMAVAATTSDSMVAATTHSESMAAESSKRLPTTASQATVGSSENQSIPLSRPKRQRRPNPNYASLKE
nr:uncharacterized protein LOC109187050 [Ipomoea trifida]